MIDRLGRDLKVTDADVTSTLDRLNSARGELGWAELPPYAWRMSELAGPVGDGTHEQGWVDRERARRDPTPSSAASERGNRSTRYRGRAWGQRVMRAPGTRPRAAHDEAPGRPTTLPAPLSRALRRQRQRGRQRSTLKDSPNFSLTLAPPLTWAGWGWAEPASAPPGRPSAGSTSVGRRWTRRQAAACRGWQRPRDVAARTTRSKLDQPSPPLGASEPVVPAPRVQGPGVL